jgi:four helix bundle protein
MGNIAEAHGRYSFEDKRRFLDIAAGSCKETQSHGYVALDQGYISEHDFRDAYTQAETVGRLLSGMIANLELQISARQSAGKRMRSTKNRP